MQVMGDFFAMRPMALSAIAYNLIVMTEGCGLRVTNQATYVLVHRRNVMGGID